MDLRDDFSLMDYKSIFLFQVWYKGQDEAKIIRDTGYLCRALEDGVLNRYFDEMALEFDVDGATVLPDDGGHLATHLNTNMMPKTLTKESTDFEKDIHEEKKQPLGKKKVVIHGCDDGFMKVGSQVGLGVKQDPSIDMKDSPTTINPLD